MIERCRRDTGRLALFFARRLDAARRRSKMEVVGDVPTSAETRMTSNDSVSSKAARARLKAKGGASFGASLQPDVAAIVTNAMGKWGCSRNAALNELVRMAGDQHGFTPPEPDDLGPVFDEARIEQRSTELP